MIEVYAVIVTYNPNLEILEKGLMALSCQVSMIIVVDNHSANATEIIDLCQSIDNCQSINLQDNEGIGFAQNKGIKKALDLNASHVILFDQDSIVDKGFVCNLLQAEKTAIAEGVNVGITGPVYKSPNDNFLYPIYTFNGNKYIQLKIDNSKEYIEVTHVIASGELIRREVFDLVGYMREDLFISQVDYEFCFRSSFYGFSIIRASNASMTHNMGDKQFSILGRKIGIYSPFRRYFTCRNGVLLLKDKYYPKKAAWISVKLSFLRTIVGILYGPNRTKQLKYSCRGFWDGIKGVSGKCPLTH